MIFRTDLFADLSCFLNKDPRSGLVHIQSKVLHVDIAFAQLKNGCGTHKEVYEALQELAASVINTMEKGDDGNRQYHPESGYRGQSWPGYQSNLEGTRSEKTLQLVRDRCCIVCEKPIGGDDKWIAKRKWFIHAVCEKRREHMQEQNTDKEEFDLSEADEFFHDYP